MSITQRRIKLVSRDSSELDRMTYENGEVYFDQTNFTLRLMDSLQQGGVKLATQPWVQNNLNTVAQPMSLTSPVQSTSTGTGSLKVSGGAGIVKNLYVGQELHVASATYLTSTLAVTDDVTVATNKFTIDAQTGNTAVAGTLTVADDLAVATNKFTVDAQTGNTLVAGALDLTGALRVNTNKFTVDAATGNTLVAGTLNVTGDLDVTGQFILRGNVQLGDANTDNVTFSSDVNSNIVPNATNTHDLGTSDYRWRKLWANSIDVLGTSTFSDDIAVGVNKFTVDAQTGDVLAAGIVDVTGDLRINANKFTVAATTGNTAVAGTLSAVSDFKVNTNKFTVDAATGNTVVAGTLSATGITQLLSTLAVTDDFAVATNKFTVDAQTGNTAAAGTLAVTGDFAVATNQFTVTASNGAASFNGNVVIEGSLTTKGASYQLSGASELSGPLISLHTGTLISNDNFDIGVFYNYYDTSSKSGWFGRKNTTGYWEFLNDTSVAGGVFSGTYGTVKAGSFISTGASTFDSDIEVNGALNTSQTSFDIVNTAQTVNIGAATSVTTINDELVVENALTVNSGEITSPSDTANLLNTDVLTVNAFSAATEINVGNTETVTYIQGETQVDTIDVDVSITSAATTVTVFDTTVATINMGGEADQVYIGDQATGTVTTANLTVNGAITESSSISLKENINPIANALDIISRLEGVTYDRRNGSSANEAGLIAEHVALVLPNLVKFDAMGNAEGINYSKLTAYLIEAVKELNAKISQR